MILTNLLIKILILAKVKNQYMNYFFLEPDEFTLEPKILYACEGFEKKFSLKINTEKFRLKNGIEITDDRFSGEYSFHFFNLAIKRGPNGGEPAEGFSSLETPEGKSFNKSFSFFIAYKENRINIFYDDFYFTDFVSGTVAYNWLSFDNQKVSFNLWPEFNIVMKKFHFFEIFLDNLNLGGEGCLNYKFTNECAYLPSNTEIVIKFPSKNFSDPDYFIDSIGLFNELDCKLFVNDKKILSPTCNKLNNDLFISDFLTEDLSEKEINFKICNFKTSFLSDKVKFSLKLKESEPNNFFAENRQKINIYLPEIQINFIKGEKLKEKEIFNIQFMLKSEEKLMIEPNNFLFFKFKNLLLYMKKLKIQITDKKSNYIINKDFLGPDNEGYLIKLEKPLFFDKEIFIIISSDINLPINSFGFESIEIFIKNKEDFEIGKIDVQFEILKLEYQLDTVETDNNQPGNINSIFFKIFYKNLFSKENNLVDIYVNLKNYAIIKEIFYEKIEFNSVKLEKENILLNEDENFALIKNIDLSKESKINLNFHGILNNPYHTNPTLINIKIKNKNQDLYNSNFEVQLERPTFNLKFEKVSHVNGNYIFEIIFHFTKQIIKNHYLRIGLPLGIKIIEKTNCLSTENFEIPEINLCEKISGNYKLNYFKVKNFLNNAKINTEYKLKIKAQNSENSVSRISSLNMDVFADYPEIPFLEIPNSEFSLSQKSILKFEIPCSDNCDLCEDKIERCEKCKIDFELKDQKCFLINQGNNIETIFFTDFKISGKFQKVFESIFINFYILGIILVVFLKLVYNEFFKVIEFICALLIFFHSFISYLILWKILDDNNNRTKFSIILTLLSIYFITNLVSSFYFFSKNKNKLLMHINIFGLKSNSIIFFLFYMIFGTGCSLWIIAFHYLDFFKQIYTSISEKKNYSKLFLTIKWINCVNVMIITLGFFLTLILSEGNSKFIYFYIANGFVTFLIFLLSIILSPKKEYSQIAYKKDNIKKNNFEDFYNESVCGSDVNFDLDNSTFVMDNNLKNHIRKLKTFMETLR